MGVATMFLIRQAAKSDHRQLIRLARELGSINLPTEPGELAGALERSARSFAGRIRDHARAVYIFCAEPAGGSRLAGASMIIAKHGTPQSPHYYLEMDSEERYSHTLRKMFRHSYLRLRHSMDGPTEIGGLIVAPAMRRNPEKIGKQLSWVRFLYIARHPHRFGARVIAEMLSPLTPNGSNLFWEHYGHPVTGLTFREADRLSVHDKEFIRALFPEAPLYTFMMPADVRASLGAVGDQSRGAVRILEQAGMKFLGEIDPFDAGPYYGAPITELAPVREFKRYRAVRGSAATGEAGRLYMAGCWDAARGFRAVQVAGVTDGRHLAMPPEALDALRIKEGAVVDTVPLP
jgi:arginine N-succinyltransferase